MGSKYLVFRNYSFLLLNGHSIHGLCLTFWTNEFLGSYSNYKFIISFSIFNRMVIICISKLFIFHFLKSFYGPFILSIIGQYTLCLLNNNSFSLSFFFLSSLSFLWIGAQFPQEKFLSYARILTLYYYFLLMCILFVKKKKK